LEEKRVSAWKNSWNFDDLEPFYFNCSSKANGIS